MRKVLAVLVAVSLLGIAPAQAATKPGSKCAKAGATINSAGKKFTCIKSSGKLVWNKGVTIKKSTGACKCIDFDDRGSCRRVRDES